MSAVPGSQADAAASRGLARGARPLYFRSDTDVSLPGGKGMRSPHLSASVNLDAIRASAERIAAATRVDLIAVIKADGYGLGAERVADALASVAREFAYFSIEEAAAVRKPGIVLGPPTARPEEYQALRLRPAVSSVSEATRFRDVPALLCVDTGMQRFGCDPQDVPRILARATIEEAFTHTTRIAGVESLSAACAGRVPRLHAAATALLGTPAAWLDAVRPGMALYDGALRVTTRLHSVRDVRGPVGYSGFDAPRVGVILAGYSNGLRPAPVEINGRPQRILECGMNTSFVSADPRDREGDEVVLLGSELTEHALAAHFGTRPHEILCRYASAGIRTYNQRAAVISFSRAAAG